MGKLVRSISFRADATDEGIIKGYASLHNKRLDECSHCEIFEKGCWEKSIEDLFRKPLSLGEPSRVSVCWQHDWEKPFAVVTHMADDDKGLYTEARVELRGAGEVNADAWAQVKAGLVTGLSVEIDPSRSVYEYLGEVEARELGFVGEWVPWAAPRRWKQVYLLGWAYVLVPSMAGARVTEVRSFGARKGKEVRAMDEEQVKAIIEAACKPLYERIGALEAKMEPKEEMPEGEVKVEVEEVRSLKSEVERLKADAAEARYQAWRAAHAPSVDDKVARHIYAAPEDLRAAMLPKADPKAPNLPALGAGSGMREASGGGDPEAAKRALYDACLREAKYDETAARRLYTARRMAQG